jgi:hypothetical protein
VALDILRKPARVHLIKSSGKSNSRPIIWDDRWPNRKKSDGARPGEYGGWGAGCAGIFEILQWHFWFVYRWIVHVNHKPFFCLTATLIIGRVLKTHKMWSMKYVESNEVPGGRQAMRWIPETRQKTMEVASKSIRPILRYEINKIAILAWLKFERFI